MSNFRKFEWAGDKNSVILVNMDFVTRIYKGSVQGEVVLEIALEAQPITVLGYLDEFPVKE